MLIVSVMAGLDQQGTCNMAVLNFYHIGKQIPEGAVYIGRGGKGLTQSKFANPFKLSENEERGATLFRYKTWLWNECLKGNITKSDILALDGKDLVCFCSPKPCHGDVIIELINYVKTHGEYFDYCVQEYKRTTGNM